MGFVNLKEMAKRLKRTEEEVMTYVESGILKGSYCYPAHFGDGREIAFFPEKVLAQIKVKKEKDKIEAELKAEKELEDEKTKEEEPQSEQQSEKTEGETKDPFEEAKKQKPKKDKTKK